MIDVNPSSLPPISCNGVWKVYGKRAEEAMRAIDERNLSKEEVFNEFGCVVGVADVTFDVQEGEIFCIMGLSGSGKSTLVRHINRLIEPTFGEINIRGKNINILNEEELRSLRASTIGMVFQHMALWPHRSVADNVSFGLEVQGVDKATRRKAAETALAQVDLDNWIDRYPDELSGGMKQRVGLARAIASDPPILLMDEPFSALDPLIRRQLQDQFIELSKVMNKTTVFITHDLDEAIRIGDRIAIMNDGRIVQIGTPEEIVANPANDYVEKFVAGISRLQIVKARSVMQPIDIYKKTNADAIQLMEDSPVVRPDTDLDGVINQFVLHEDNQVIRVADETGDLGVITSFDLLRGLQGAKKNQEEY